MSSNTTYSGYLAHKRKAELEEIAKALDISAEGTKADLETAIKNKFTEDESARSDPRFTHLTGLGVKRSSPSNSTSLTESPSLSDGIQVVVNSSASKTKRSSVSSRDLAARALDAASNVVNEASDKVEALLPDSLESARNQLVRAADKQLAVVRQLDSNQVIRGALHFAHQAEEQLARTAKAAQLRLSDGWTLIAVTVAAELLFILFATVPLSRKVNVGPMEWLSWPWTPSTPFSVTLPDLLVLRQYGVARPILAWFLTSVLLPGIGAHLVVFPRPLEGGGRRTRSSSSSSSNYYLGLHPPSALSFSIFRLALTYYVNNMQTSSFWLFPASDIISRFGSVQTLCAAVALAFTTYELLA